MRHLNSQDILPVLAALRSAEYRHRSGSEAQSVRPPTPFVTISRQAGAGGRSLAKRLALRLNEREHADVPWTVWDNELVERVAAELRLPASRIAALEDVRPTWLEAALGSLAVTSDPSGQMTVFHRVAATIRSLAEIGRVIIVGRGAGFVTADLPGGVHVRLVAPRDRRIEWTAQSMGISPEVAADWVKEKDAAREAFYRRYFPSRPLIPENFTATFNTAAATDDQLEESVMALVTTGVLSGTPVVTKEVAKA